MANNTADTEFNTLLFEKKLTNLKDSQESINTCCHWCLENRQHHKKIVSAWLNVLKRVKVEHRLTLFYLANDVIQYSKRRNYDFVESWGTSLQKATPLVRDEKVKNKILRIFKIWEQRGVYGEEFIGDLSGLISATPPTRKSDEPHEFESQYLITKIRNCAKLEGETDQRLKKFKEHNPKILEGESMFASLKDRAHVDDVEKEMEEYVKHMEAYINALKNEIKARNHLISLLVQAENQLDKDKKDVKLVANAYKAFASRVKNLKKKLDELKPTLSSPIPSPDINAPSPSPDSDDELPEPDNAPRNQFSASPDYSAFANPGFYNPVPPPTASENSNDFLNNGFSSFMGGNMPFSLQTLFNNNSTTTTTGTTSSYNTSSMFSTSVPPPPPVVTTNTTDYQYNTTSVPPMMPPPIPPFSKTDSGYGTGSTYTDSYSSTTNTTYCNPSYDSSVSSYPTSVPPPYQTPVTNYQTSDTSYPPPSVTSYSVPAPAYETGTSTFPTPDADFQGPISYPPPSTNNSFTGADEYNPEEEPETWDNEVSWDAPPVIDLDTPESPPLFEKEGFSDPIEYHDMPAHGTGVDMDHRVLPVLPDIPLQENDMMIGHRKKDVDHRNLISLTGSPRDNNSNSDWSTSGADQEYRTSQKSGPGGSDQDYRVPFSLDNLKLPPPPPPPNQVVSPIKTVTPVKKTQSPRKLQDKVEIIDMELSDDEACIIENTSVSDNLTVVPIVKEVPKAAMLEPPPPLPDLPEDVDANNLLDDIDNELNSNEFLEQEDPDCAENNFMDRGPPAFPPGFNNPAPWNNSMPIPGALGELMHPGLPPELQPPNMVEIHPTVAVLPPSGIAMGMSPMNSFPFRGRGGNRGNFNHINNRGHSDFRGRGVRGNWAFRGANNRGSPNFRGNWHSPRGSPIRGNMVRGRPPFFRGNFRGAF